MGKYTSISHWVGIEKMWMDLEQKFVQEMLKALKALRADKSLNTVQEMN